MNFFFVKILKDCLPFSWTFSGLASDLCLVYFVSLVKKKASRVIEQQKCRSHEKRDPFVLQKIDLNYRFPSGVKTSQIVFSN